jgi:hypothetical protein
MIHLLLFADIACHVVSVTDLYGRILCFLEEPLLFYQVAPQLNGPRSRPIAFFSGSAELKSLNANIKTSNVRSKTNTYSK